MAKKETTAKPAKNVPVFTKEALIASVKYQDDIDLLTVMLEDGGTYTAEEVDKVIADYKKKEVK